MNFLRKFNFLGGVIVGMTSKYARSILLLSISNRMDSVFLVYRLFSLFEQH